MILYLAEMFVTSKVVYMKAESTTDLLCSRKSISVSNYFHSPKFEHYFRDLLTSERNVAPSAEFIKLLSYLFISKISDYLWVHSIEIVNNIGCAPFAETLMLRITDFTEAVLSEKADLPFPIILNILSGTIVVHLHSADPDTLRNATHTKILSTGNEYQDEINASKTITDFPKGYTHHGVLTMIKSLVGGYNI